MSKIPECVSRQFVSGAGLGSASRGKVRDSYILGTGHLLPIATDRVSIFDFILPAEVPGKGEVLTAMNVFWARRKLIADRFPQDLIAYGAGIDEHFLPEFRGNPELHKRATVVKKLNMLPVEAIVRGCLTGSGWTAYQETAPDHKVCGWSLLPGLRDGDALPAPIFTPTTKAAVGHDEHMDAGKVQKKFGSGIETEALELFHVANEIALARGIVLADTKFEFGTDPITGKLTLGDERLTPDSSRYWLFTDWEASRKEGRSPTSFDKQFVREWGKTVGIDKLDPKIEDHVRQVRALTVPQEVLERTARIYRYIFFMLTGWRLEKFQREVMGIHADALPSVEIVLGSKSDFPHIESGLAILREAGVSYRLHVISCHRNPEVLMQYARDIDPNVGVVIAAAGKAAALPGVLHAWLRHFKKDYIPVLGVALPGDNEAENSAARLSIEELPGKPVILDNGGSAYFGATTGFGKACEHAVAKEFISLPSASKPTALNLLVSK